MKNLFLIFTILFVANFAIAQSGTWYIGGSAGFSSSQSKIAGKVNEQSKLSVFDFSPEIGYWFTDNVQVGTAFNIVNSKVGKNDGDISFGITPYARYWFSPGNDFRTFVGARLGYMDGFASIDQNISDATSTMFGLDFGFGYNLSPRFAVVGRLAGLEFSSLSYKVLNEEVRDTGFNLFGNTYGSPFNIGLYYTLNAASR